MFVHRIRQVLDPRHDFVFVGKDVVEYRRAVAAHCSRPGRHRQCDTRLGAFRVIRSVTFLGHAILRVGRFMARRHNPIAQCEVFELKRLEQWISGHRGILGAND
jgi:hypothetical protein